MKRIVMTSALVAILALLAAMVGSGASPAFAHQAQQGKPSSYGCTQNPSAPQCLTPLPACVANGSVSGVSTSGSCLLPQTGGAVPSGPTRSMPMVLVMIGLLCLMSSFAIRRLVRQHARIT
jgi:hypothetical protein